VIGPWFIETFVAATGLAAVHHVVLLPPEPTCVERVQSRVGHGFANVDAPGTCTKTLRLPPSTPVTSSQVPRAPSRSLRASSDSFRTDLCYGRSTRPDPSDSGTPRPDPSDSGTPRGGFCNLQRASLRPH
jgi:hypothetical protein